MSLIDYEIKLWNEGHKIIAGVDEVGRGCLAGPIVTAAVVWPQITTSLKERNSYKDWINLINDSKKLSFKTRTLLAEKIKKHASAYAIVEISNTEIDQFGIGTINKMALENAVNKLNIKPDIVLVDHFKIFEKKSFNVKAITKGDLISFTVASASIIAKDYRDNLMRTKYHIEFPLYGFDKHVGYGTKAHIEAIKQNGLTKIHRTSFHLKSETYKPANKPS